MKQNFMEHYDGHLKYRLASAGRPVSRLQCDAARFDGACSYMSRFIGAITRAELVHHNRTVHQKRKAYDQSKDDPCVRIASSHVYYLNAIYHIRAVGP